MQARGDLESSSREILGKEIWNLVLEQKQEHKNEEEEKIGRTGQAMGTDCISKDGDTDVAPISYALAMWCWHSSTKRWGATTPPINLGRTL